MNFLFVDRITALQSNVATSGIKHVSADDYYLTQDTSGRWCFIPSLVGETLGQLAAWNVMSSCDFEKRPVAGYVGEVIMHRPAYLGETVVLNTQIESVDDAGVHYHGQAYVGDALIVELNGAVGPFLSMSDFIDKSVVQRQFDEIYRPWGVEKPIDSAVMGQAASLLREWNSPSSRSAPMQFDAIIEHEPLTRMVAEKHVTRAAAFFADHFPHKPVLPMSVLMEYFVNLADIFLAQAQDVKRLRVHQLQRIKMNDFIYPGDVVTASMSLKKPAADGASLTLACRAEVAGRRVAVLEIICKEDGIIQ